MKKAIYAGSFDPLTLGHSWVIEESLSLFDELIIAIGENPQKKSWFSLEERLKMLEEEYDEKEKVTISSFRDQYLVNYAKSESCNYIIRGIRNAEDFSYESMLKEINYSIDPEIKTIFLMPPKELAMVSSSIVKSLVGPRGWQSEIQKYVPSKVYSHILNRR